MTKVELDVYRERLQSLRCRLNGDVSGAPITFQAGGRQYVAVGAGGKIAQTTSFAGLTKTDIPIGPGMIWVFALPQ